MSEIDIGDKIADSPVGPGTLTGITQAGYPQVDHVAVAWLVAEDGEVYDPRGVRERNATDETRIAP